MSFWLPFQTREYFCKWSVDFNNVVENTMCIVEITGNYRIHRFRKKFLFCIRNLQGQSWNRTFVILFFVLKAAGRLGSNFPPHLPLVPSDSTAKRSTAVLAGGSSCDSGKTMPKINKQSNAYQNKSGPPSSCCASPLDMKPTPVKWNGISISISKYCRIFFIDTYFHLSCSVSFCVWGLIEFSLNNFRVNWVNHD